MTHEIIDSPLPPLSTPHHPVPAPEWSPMQPYARKSPRSLRYASSWLQDRQNLYLPRRLCFRIVEIPTLRGRCRFLHAKKNYIPACSIFGAPKFSTCDTKNIKVRPITLFGHLGTPYMLWKWLTNRTDKIFCGGQPKRLRFSPPTGAYRYAFSSIFLDLQDFLAAMSK